MTTEQPAPQPVPLVSCHGVGRTFGEGPAAIVALHDASATLQPGDCVAITGPSGSGKSTLLHLLAGLDQPTRGSVTWPALGSAALRPGPVSVIFQGPSLVPALNVIENVALPRVLGGVDQTTATAEAWTALDRLDLSFLAEKLPEELSGGQAQRVAVARTLAGQPQLILADEPTGQVDHETGSTLIDSLLQTVDHLGAGLIVTTHDESVAARMALTWTMRDGALESSEGAACSA